MKVDLGARQEALLEKRSLMKERAARWKTGSLDEAEVESSDVGRGKEICVKQRRYGGR